MSETTQDKIDFVNKTAKLFNCAERDYQNALYDLTRGLAVIPDEQFWPMVKDFTPKVLSSLAAGRDVKASVHNYSILFENDETLTFIRFVKTWSAIGNRLYEPLLKVVERGDDGHADLTDSLPLAGREVFDKVVSGYYGNEQALLDAITESLRPLIVGPVPTITTQRLNRAVGHILHGENYYHMKMEEKVAERIATRFI